MKFYTALLAVAALAVGCSKHEPTNLGGVLIGERATVAQMAEFEPGAAVLIEGTMTKKCPVAGCWFMLNDKTGTVKVDLKNSEFVVVDVPLKSKMLVSGRVMTNETERYIEGMGVRF
jgi:uncharacterized protein YdeI (BOF family)